ncbi:helix-turn-helix domain-containing protein [Jeongeupia sp. USM3]|uniref:winged helix-turn-helix domain-containing protein n=1 Tax=Jeongeupia sp. USM3 TaxID=1906741 RepID=UPI0009F4DB14|nr:helix-turn-helix domain-containing protein [Jeongeupia sp. USM3]
MLILHWARQFYIDLDTGLTHSVASGRPQPCGIRMGRRECTLLRHLAQHDGRPFSREYLQALVFAGHGNGAALLSAAIAQIRRRLANADPECRCLKTLDGFGYRFESALSGLDIIGIPESATFCNPDESASFKGTHHETHAADRRLDCQPAIGRL